MKRLGRNCIQPEVSRSTGKIAMKAINHYGDEVLKVFAM